MMEALGSSETSVLTRATRRNIIVTAVKTSNLQQEISLNTENELYNITSNTDKAKLEEKADETSNICRPNTSTVILDIINLPVFYTKRNVSETELYFRLHVEPT
jgi:hypothetical protein